MTWATIAPGLVAAKNYQVVSPLVDAGFAKADIRALATHLGLENADKPQAACLSSRFPYGSHITEERLAQVEAAEDALAELGFVQYRVRHHEEVAPGRTTRGGPAARHRTLRRDRNRHQGGRLPLRGAGPRRLPLRLPQRGARKARYRQAHRRRADPRARPMIERIEFGGTGHLSTRTIFGAAGLGGMKQDRADQVLDILLEFGVNHIDTRRRLRRL